MKSSSSDEPGGIPGHVVLVVFFTLVFLIAASAVTFIRRPPGTTPAAVENRPFGPATRQEQTQSEQQDLDQPLLYRGSQGLGPEPASSPAPVGAAKP
jgi:hypothetical protein